MANQRPSSSPSPQEDTFLGGGVQFNKVGTSIPGSQASVSDDEPAIVLSSADARTRAIRTIVIVTALVLLVALLFVFSNDSVGGIQHATGRGGISSTHTAAPPRNF